MTDWSHLSKDAFEEWYRTRYDDKEMDERQQRILREGLHCKVSLKLLHGSLWAIVIDPSAGFTHLMTEAGLQEMRKRKDVLHVSICFKSDIKTPWQHSMLYALNSRYMFPKDHVFKIEWFGSGATANLSPEDTVYKDIVGLHRSGSYWNRNMHISM